MNRIEISFKKLKKKSEIALIPYVPIYSKSLSRSFRIVEALIRGGADMLELAVPSVCPWIDGAVLQKYHVTALKNGVNSADIFHFSKMLNKKYTSTPIWLISYLSEILKIQPRKFADLCNDSGIDALDAPNYPLNDPLRYHSHLRRRNVHLVRAIDEATARIETTRQLHELKTRIVRSTSGLLLLMASPGGLAGERTRLESANLRKAVNSLKSLMSRIDHELPIVIVTGISSPEHIRQIVKYTESDGVMIGSAFVRRIQEGCTMNALTNFTRDLKNETARS